ncbi:MAG: ABC transporter permease, partial [Acetatifactor sp.]|nr:ABC transporter permease [Acetatifactor sp.]
AVQGPLYALLNMIHMGDWMKYTIYHTLDLGPAHYAAPADLYVYVVGAGFLILYTIVSGIILKKQDI